MKIFVSGCGSFIGKEVLRLGRNKGIETVGVDLVDTGQEGCSVGDIRSPKITEKIPENVDAIVHLAALSRDPDCRGKAYTCFDANVMGTLNLMEAAKAKGARQFIFASSEWVYDSFEDGVAKKEDDVINVAGITSEYALSKLVSEANLRQAHQQGFCPVTILRFGIVYGPRRSNWSAVESIFSSVSTQDEVTVGSLKNGRRFIHVSDIASAVIAAIGLGGFEIINVQGQKLITLGEVIETSKKLVQRNPKVVERTPEQTNLRMVSGEKARQLLPWQPEITLPAGLKSVADFLGIKTADIVN
ncbi:MAG TPA: NAD(P)-dependent oxidoreductase [Candidatus Eisenbacteria bacterium]|nr:NAD(P)-dependent oxidoreductase [Candidatus Eisenbacteria bacterium]